MKIIQINLQHCKAASALLSKRLIEDNIDIALIQEPWLYKGSIRGIRCTKGSIYRPCNENPRSCIFAKDWVNALLYTEHCSRDVTTIHTTMEEAGERKTIIISSAYLPYEDSDPPSTTVRDLVTHCEDNGKELIMGIDANAHHTCWGSTDINPRGEKLMEYLVSTTLNILNRGNEPTFVTSRREEVIDITLGTNIIENLVSGWHVSPEITSSDHRYICFEIKTQVTLPVIYRNPKKTDWDGYRRDLSALISGISRNIRSTLDVEFAVEELQQSILLSYIVNCQPRAAYSPRLVPWWSKELSRLRKKARKLFLLAKRTGDWDSYRQALTNYNKEIRKAKRNSWKEYCQGMESVPSSARFMKQMANGVRKIVSTIKLPDGSYTQSGYETLLQLARAHFPDSKVDNDSNSVRGQPNLDYLSLDREDWYLIRKVVNVTKIRWAIKSFGPYKSAGPDLIIPALLQQGIDSIQSLLCSIYRVCLAYGYIPMAWRQTKVVFIPKPGRPSYAQAKAYRPISLSSFMLKTLERLVDRHIRDNVFMEHPLNKYQFAYQTGKSTEAALHQVVSTIEKALETKEIAIGAFLDIEGAFDRTTCDVVSNALYEHDVPSLLSEWIRFVLRHRTITMNLCGETLGVTTARGCPQGGVLSPLLWNLVVDTLLCALNGNGYFSVGFADDIAIIIRGKFPLIVSQVLQMALEKVEAWCKRNKLTVNPSKSVVVPFTRRREPDLIRLSLFGEVVPYSTQVKYLGLILDKNLTWKQHMESCITKAYRVFWTCRRMLGKTWGLKPSIVYWIYTAMVRPIFSYAALMWWPRVNLTVCIKELSKLQRTFCISIMGAFKTTPTAAMEMLIGLTPLHIWMKAEAMIAYHRICRQTKVYNTGNIKHLKLPWDRSVQQILEMGTDILEPRLKFELNFTVSYPQRCEWERQVKPNKNKAQSGTLMVPKLSQERGLGFMVMVHRFLIV